jgi:hypothetical protein
MSRLLTALIAAGFGIGLNAAVAQNVNSEKDKAQGQDTQPAGAQSAKTSKDCSNMSGKDKEKCIQATPAGAVDTSTGEGSKAKGAIAKERDREKAQSPNESGIPAQSNSAVGHPNQQGTTGEGQNGPGAAKNIQSGQSDQTQSGKTMPPQSKDSVGHPEERATTGEAQSLQESAPTGGNSSNQKSTKEPAKSDKLPK